MKIKKLESGRSMVEMLGVLAIIGVLSVGGIAGYSHSMRKHRANQIVDAIAKYASLAYGLCQQKITNGEAVISDGGAYAGCSDSDNLIADYEHTDLGQLPAGVTKISHRMIDASSTTAEAMVLTEVVFSDQKLCQAVAAFSAYHVSSCDKGENGYINYFFINMN